MKAVILLLALMLVVGGAKVLSGQNATAAAVDGPDHDHGHGHDHHAHYQPLLEMLPPIGPIGIVAIVVVADMNYSRRDPVRGTEEKADARPRGDTNATAGSTPSITAKLVKELTLRERVVGEYESKMDGDTGRLVLRENGIKELYLNGEKGLESTWSISKEGELHLIFVEGGFTGVARINKDSSITTIAEITKDGRRNHSKEEQLTFKKIK